MGLASLLPRTVVLIGSVKYLRFAIPRSLSYIEKNSSLSYTDDDPLMKLNMGGESIFSAYFSKSFEQAGFSILKSHVIFQYLLLHKR